jgi:hypothetical protein
MLSDDVLVHLRCLTHLEFASAEHDPQPLLLNCAPSLQCVIIHIGGCSNLFCFVFSLTSSQEINAYHYRNSPPCPIFTRLL